MNPAVDISKEAYETSGRQTQSALMNGVDAPIQQDPEKLGGRPTVFAKRVPVETLINYLANGRTVQDFLADYDAVTEGEVLAILNLIKQAVLDGMLTGVHLRREDSF
jgi:uncharacterized protein (DUF433 family)